MDNKCWICGKQEPMMFTCRHCGKTFCSDHRLPERHACEGLDRGTGFSSGNSGTSGYSRTYTGGQSYGPEMDEVIKNMMKDAARNAAKGAATGAVHRTKSSISTSPSMAIIFICIISFFLELIIPGYIELFQLVPSTMFSRPWTLITHMFLHGGFGHIFFNMLVLFFFGRELERRIGKNMFLYVYFVSGIVAALGYAITSNTGLPMIGASGAIMGVFATLTVLAPEMQVYVYFIPMRIKYALLLFALLDFALIGANDMIAHTAHLSGVLVGLYMGFRIKGSGKNRRRAGYDTRRW